MSNERVYFNLKDDIIPEGFTKEECEKIWQMHCTDYDGDTFMVIYDIDGTIRKDLMGL